MGREIKRVALDFDWPVGKVWEGYLQQEESPAETCEKCGGSGSSPEAGRFKNEWYGYENFDPASMGSKLFGWNHPAVMRLAERNILRSFETGAMRERGPGDAMGIQQEAIRLAGMWDSMWMHHLCQDDVDALVAGGRLHDFTSVWKEGEGWVDKDPPYKPTAVEVNEWSLHGFGHDAINQWICVEARCRREGVPYKCSACDGHGEIWPSQEEKERYELWTKTEPPAGEGWQLWSTTTEGHPMTPVFRTSYLLAEHCAENQMDPVRRWNNLAGGDAPLTFSQWINFIEGAGWAPSAVMGGGRFMSGVEAVTQPKEVQ